MTDANNKPKLDEHYIMNLKGKDFVQYGGLVDLATQMGLASLSVAVLQYPTEENQMTCICQATAVDKEGRSFTDIGDANPRNVNEKIVPHLIRMASTRAKGRALRDLTNIGMTCLEELADIAEERGNGGHNHAPAKEPAKPQPAAKQPPASSSNTPAPANGKTATEAQLRAIRGLVNKQGGDEDWIQGESHNRYGCALESITTAQASDFIKALQAK